MYNFITPIEKATIFDKEVFVKDESFCPTGTFKDRLAYKLSHFANVWSNKKVLISCITMGNTLQSIKWAVDDFFDSNYDITICGLFPKGFGERLLGPNSLGEFKNGQYYYDKLNSNTLICAEIDLSKYLNNVDIRGICENITNQKYDIHLDLSYGLDQSGYDDIIHECYETNNWDFILVPFGAGILFEEAYKYVDRNNYKASVLGVTTNLEESIADKLYSFYSKYFTELNENGFISVGSNNKHKVITISEDDIKIAIKEISGLFHSEPSSAATFHLIKKINIPSKILIINTGKGF